MANNQLQRLSLDKSLFWTGTLELDENGGHVFFDVRIKKSISNLPMMVGLFTNDIPPFPLKQANRLKVTFVLENNQGMTCTRHEIGTGSISGSELEEFLKKETPSNNSIVIINESGEWQFQFISKEVGYVIKSLMIYAQMSTLRQHVKDL